MLLRQRFLLAAGCAGAMMVSLALAQPPGDGPKDGPKDGPGKDRPRSGGTNSIVDRMMAFDKNKDGKLTKDEITDERLHRLFDQADANKDGVVTREELEALAAKMATESRGSNRGGPGGGPGGFGGPGGPGGPGGGGMPRPGQILPTFLQEHLELTAEQKAQVAELQKDVDTKLAKILTDEQNKQLKEMREFAGPGGEGGRQRRPGGPGGGRPPE